ncbi:MAG TPA: signal peptidase II [Bacilli bacterium]|nr:signal peptidase II [Bacilli bacterium]
MAGKIANYFKSKNIKEIARDFFLSFVWLIILIFVIDLVSKWVVVNNMNVYTDITVIENFFYLRLSFNQGAAFGLGNTGDIEWRIFFIAVSAVIGTAMLVYYIKKYRTLSIVMKIAVAMMIAGAYGNLIDRALYWPSTVGFSGVVDFLSFEFWGRRFATFNVADMSLVVGVIILLFAIVIEDIRIAKNKEGKEDLSKPSAEYLADKEKKHGGEDEKL